MGHILGVRLDAETLDRLAIMARKKGIGPSTLARIWLMERLAEEEEAGQQRACTALAHSRGVALVPNCSLRTEAKLQRPGTVVMLVGSHATIWHIGVLNLRRLATPRGLGAGNTCGLLKANRQGGGPLF